MRGNLYNSDQYPELHKWYELRAKPAPHPVHLPQIGWIVPGVAAGFLTQCEGEIGFLEYFVSNPEASSELREAGLQQVVGELKDLAHDLGLRRLITFTHVEAIGKRALRNNFTSKGTYTMYVSEI